MNLGKIKAIPWLISHSHQLDIKNKPNYTKEKRILVVVTKYNAHPCYIFLF